MIKIIDDGRLRTPEEIEKEYENCKYVLTDFDDMQALKGNLYCISDSNETFREICLINHNLTKEGRQSILMGSYNNGGAIGVQYEIS